MRALSVLCMMLVAVGCVHGAPCKSRAASKPVTGFINKTMQVNGEERRYVVYVPSDYTPDKAWPLVMFLHGAGERGSDGLMQSQVGIGAAVRWNVDRFPCIIVMPQCPKAAQWLDRQADIDVCLAAARAEYKTDPKRTYLTGLSMGGFGTWAYGAKHADMFAALLPICGGGNPAEAANLAAVPIWAFHGAVDSVVPVAKTREMVEAVKKAGGKIDYTEYPATDHNSWDATYGDGKVIAWMLQQHK